MPSFVYNPVIGVDVRGPVDLDNMDTLGPHQTITINSDDLRWITANTITTPICSATTGGPEVAGTTAREFIIDELADPFREYLATNNIKIVDSKVVEEFYDNPYENTEEWLSLLEEK